jgi:predicted amidophosphoribosyltransferase
MMDPGSHTPVGSPLLIGTCPECGKEWSEGLAICPHCGYIKRQCPGCGAAWVTGAMFCSKCGFGKAADQQNAQASQ